ncbi:hypothetical protein ACKI1K_46600, partial [Streptomyces scabiei]|uniref:hypothetical protein n=1 Tax=Streptomyces scabiei TaxID=1930 RepID=UPI0038F6973D
MRPQMCHIDQQGVQGIHVSGVCVPPHTRYPGRSYGYVTGFVGPEPGMVFLILRVASHRIGGWFAAQFD